jgi:hypothetical protein
MTALQHALLLGRSTQAVATDVYQSGYLLTKIQEQHRGCAVCDVSNPLVKNLGADFTTLANNPRAAVSRPTLSNPQQHHSLRTPITTYSLLQKLTHTWENPDRAPQD